MFDEQEVIEFFNRIINAPNLKEQEIKQNITKFYEYLVLTKMCEGESLKKLNKIVVCLNEILAIKKAIGYMDINTLILEPEEQKRLIKQNKKHYGHYESSSSLSCGSSTYSSSCGSASYTRRC